MMPRRVVGVGTNGADFLETSSIVGKSCFKLRRSLPPLDGDIDVARLVLDATTYAPDFLGRQNGGARTCKLVEHHVATCRTIEKRIGDERDRLYRRMGGERLSAAPAERVNARIGPDVGAIAAETTQFDIVSMWMAANPENADEFVLRTVERS